MGAPEHLTVIKDLSRNSTNPPDMFIKRLFDFLSNLKVSGILYILFAVFTAFVGFMGVSDIDIDTEPTIVFEDIQHFISLYDPDYVHRGDPLRILIDEMNDGFFVFDDASDNPFAVENYGLIGWIASANMPDIAGPNQFQIFLNDFDEQLPQGFTFLPAARDHVLPEGVLPFFFYFMFILAAFRLFLGCLSILYSKKSEMGGILGLFGKIDLWLIILTTVFMVFFVAGFSFIWFAIISFIPAMLLLRGSAKLDNRPGIATRQEARTAKIFLIPAFLGLTFITYIPLTAVFGISLFDWNFPRPMEFTGLSNYARILNESAFWNSVRVTITYAFLTVGLGMIYSMTVALLLNRKLPGRAFFRTAFYLPFIIPGVSAFMIFRLMYNPHFGLFNSIITLFGGERVNFLFSEATIIPALAVIAVWTSGNIIVIKMAGLNNVPRTYHEAAEIDGASAWYRFWRITLPVMSPIIFYNMLMSLITHMQVVIPSLMMAGGGTGGTGVVFPSYRFVTFELWMRGLAQSNFGIGSTISFLLFVLVGIFTAILFATSKTWIFYEGGAPK